MVYEGPELNHAFGLCHYKHFLFWNEYRGGSIYKLDQASKTVTLLRNERPPIFEIRVYDAHQQQGSPHMPQRLRLQVTVVTPCCVHIPGVSWCPLGTNACRLNNGGCSSLCLVIPDGRSCGCADDQTLDADNVTCRGTCGLLQAGRTFVFGGWDWREKGRKKEELSFPYVVPLCWDPSSYR